MKETIEEYFNKLCNNELGNQGKTVEQFNKELQAYSLSEIKSHLKKELLANYAGRQLTTGFGSDQPTPIEVWEGHKRLKEEAEIEYMTLSVDDFLDKVSGEPTNDEMKALYEEGSDRVPNFSSGPGFKTPRTVTVGYFAVNRQKYIDAEKAKITEAQILTQYEEWVENEDPRVVESKTGFGGLPGNDGAFSPDGNDAPNKAPTESSEVPPGLEPPKNDSEPTTGSDETKPGETPGDSKTDSATEKPTTEQEKAEPAKQETQKDEPKKSDQGIMSFGDDPFIYVSLQDEPKEKQDPAKTETAKQEPKKIEEAAKKTVDEAKQEAPPSSNDTKKAEPTTDDLPTIEEPATKPAAQDPANSDENKPGDSASGNDQSKPDPISPLDVQKAIDEAQKRVDDKPIIKPLDDKLRETIREFLAGTSNEEINKKIDADLDPIRRRVGDYLYDVEAHAETPDEYPAPKRPNFEKMAEKLGLTFKEYVDIGIDELGKTDFGKARADLPQLTRQVTTAQKIYIDFENGGGSSVEKTIPSSDNVQYVYWVTDQKYAKKVSFADAKPAIIKYYKRTKALELAEAEAKNIASNVSSQNKTLSAEFGDKVKATESFSWLKENSLWQLVQNNPQFAQQLGITSPIDLGTIQPKKTEEDAKEAPKALEGIGNNFMEKVFALDENEIGYAPNFEKDTVYIFQVIKKKEPTETEKDLVFTTNAFPSASTGGQVNQQTPKNEFNSELVDMYKIKWFGERVSK